MIIRPATPEDAGLLEEMGATTFRDAFGAQNTPENMDAYLAASFSAEIQAAELADPSSAFVIAEDEGVAVGYAKLTEGPAPAAVAGQRPIEVVRIYARREWIGRKVGALLMQTCLDVAREKGCDVLWLGVWEHNPRAIAFYRRWGFVAVGEHTFQLGSEPQRDVLMQIEI